jgi:hypothetical protein
MGTRSPFVDDYGYVRHQTTAKVRNRRHVTKTGEERRDRQGEMAKSSRNWWLIKSNTASEKGYLAIKYIVFPPKYVGKRVRLKVEIVEDNDGKARD